MPNRLIHEQILAAKGTLFEEGVFKLKGFSLLPHPSCVIHFLLNVRFLF